MELKLFVVGTKSGRPEDWDIWDEYALVMAENAQQASELSGHPFKDAVHEVVCDKPKLLVKLDEPAWGDDV